MASAMVKRQAAEKHAMWLSLQWCVPAAGTLLSGRIVSAGGIAVGSNAWVAHRNVSISGLDADKGRPER